MNAQVRKDTPSPYVAAKSPEEARKLAEELMEVMNTLLDVVERETELVRAGKLRQAMTFEQKKKELSNRYVKTVGSLKVSQTFLSRAAPELLRALHRHHDTFRAMLQVNLTVLATAHAVSENVVRGVNAEMQRRNIPSTYTAQGRRATPTARHLRPLSVSRSL
jgi:hypothetical protein